MKKKLELAMAVCLLLSAFVLARQGAILVQSERTAKKICIVIDAGHGGG